MYPKIIVKRQLSIKSSSVVVSTFCFLPQPQNPMVPLLSQAAGGGGRALLSSTHQSSLQFANPIPPLFSKHRRNFSVSRRLMPLTIAYSPESSSGGSTTKPTSSTTLPVNDEGPSSISVVGQENVPLEGVIQFEKPNSSSLLAKWGLVTVLAGGDVSALLLFSAIGRYSHGFSVFDFETFKTADHFIAGWFLSAYFLGGYEEDGRGMNGLFQAVFAAAKSWAVGVPLGLIIRAAAIGHTPPINFILVTMGSTAILLIGWRTLLFSIFPANNGKKDEAYKRGNPFELFELLTSLVRRW